MDKFIFGKYRDKSIDEIAEENPNYVIWAYENVKNPEHGGVPKDLYDNLILNDYYKYNDEYNDDEYNDVEYLGVDMWGN